MKRHSEQKFCSLIQVMTAIILFTDNGSDQLAPCSRCSASAFLLQGFCLVGWDSHQSCDHPED